MSINIITGNIFTSKCHVVVNTVNCVGVMGAGIALEYRLRYPEMHLRYIDLCAGNQINIGTLWIYKAHDRWILNFPTKKHWKYPSKIEYLRDGLDKFLKTYKDKEIQSIAFPLLGADKGGIPADQSLSTMVSFLENADIPIEIYKYDPSARDDLYEKTKKWLLSKDAGHISELTGLRKQYVNKVIDAIGLSEIKQLNQLGRVDGIGIKTLEKIFSAAQLFPEKNSNELIIQKSLLDD